MDLPARPETCTRRLNVRSAARKSGIWKPVSAFTIPTSFTPGKFSPLATICVPISTWILPSRKSASACAKHLLLLHRVRVDPPDHQVREMPLQLLLDPLGAVARVAHVQGAALRADA